MNQSPASPFKIHANPYARELASIDPELFKPIPPALQPIWPMLKAIYRRAAPKEPEKAAPGLGPNSVSPECDDYLTADEAARYLKVHPQTLRKWVRLGVFPRIPLPGRGKDFRFSRKVIDEWTEKRTLGKRDKTI
jgi:excisionase family DNA binding protein